MLGGVSRRLFSVSTACNARVGFVGLGNMGAGMAQNLVKKGHQLVVFDLDQQAVQKLEESGATPASQIQDVAKGTDAVITMLPNTKIVQDVYSSLLPVVQKGTLFIDSSTIDPIAAKELAQNAKQQGHFAVDAPVSGGVPRANAGTLTFMVGGDEDDEAKARVLLECMGASIVHAGGNGSGQVVKLCNNLSLAIQMIGMSESMNLGMKLGMDPKKMASIFNSATSRCWSSDSYNPVPGVMEGVPSSRDYEGGFGVDLMSKDLGLALDAAKAAGVISPLGEEASRVYKELQKDGFGKDFAYSFQYLKNKNRD